MTNPTLPGLPSAERLRNYRIWDSYFTPAYSNPGNDGSSATILDIERSLPAVHSGQFEKLVYFPHVGIGTTKNNEFEKLARSTPDAVLAPLLRWPDLLLGMIQLNANDLTASIDALNRWLRDGPMVGVYFRGGMPGALTCNQKGMNALVERIQQLGGIIMQHTWFKTGGKDGPGESTPSELAQIAKRFPDQKFICAHAGGEWEKGIRAVRDCPNVLIETSGFDATAGFIEMGVRELGADRIVFGSHLPTRSLGTELGKVLGADISDEARTKILGANFRKLLKQN